MRGALLVGGMLIAGCGRPTAPANSTSPAQHASGPAAAKGKPEARDDAKPTLSAPLMTSSNQMEATSRPPEAMNSSNSTENRSDPAQQVPAERGAATSRPRFRPDDVRRTHRDQDLAALGIHRYESRRLRLYTDIPAESARELPALTDQLYDALESYFGRLPPDRAGLDYQMTGYLIRDLALFRETGLVPDDLPTFEHGRHRANEFWLRDQDYAYYRAHLLLHEATHCFMTCLPGSEVDVWYMEGMAEWLATHRHRADGSVEFGIMPEAPDEVPGWGRITLIRDAFSKDEFRSIPQMFALSPRDFFQPLPYAWSWGLCQFLTAHPRYRERFQQLSRESRNAEFVTRFRELFAADAADLDTEWQLYVVNLRYGYDVVRAAIDFIPGEPLTADVASRNFALAADRGWQSSGILLRQGETYEVSATGRITLADQPKPWISEPEGISIDYADGQPIGRVLACLRSENNTGTTTMLQVLPIGRQREFVAPVTGTLYLRVNDHWNRLADNRGTYEITVRQPPAP